MSDIPAEELKRRMRDAIAAREAADGTMTFSPEEAEAARGVEVEPHLQPNEALWNDYDGVWTRRGRSVWPGFPQSEEPEWFEMGHTQLPDRSGLVERDPSRQEVEAALAAREDDER